MSGKSDNISEILRLIDTLSSNQTTGGGDIGAKPNDEVLSKLHTELKTFEDRSQTSLDRDKLEECFVKLSRLVSLSPSPMLASCCVVFLKKLQTTNRLKYHMERMKSKSDEYYTLAMDALNTRENLDYLQGNGSSATNLYRTFTESYLITVRYAIICRNRASEMLTVQEWNLRTSTIEKKHKQFLITLLSYIDERLNANKNILYGIGFFVSLSDDTNLIPDLVGCELSQHLKIWLSIFIDKQLIANYGLCESILLIIYNVARHEQGSNSLRNVHMSDALKDLWNSYGTELSKYLIGIYYMAYALLVTPDELKSTIILHDVIDFLIQNIDIASRSSNMRTSAAHMSEYLVALARLVVNDNVAQYILNTCKLNETTNGLTFFNSLFQKYNDLTLDDLYLNHLNRIALFNIFCSFSFQTAAQKSLASNEKFLEIIKEAARHKNEHDVVVQPCLLQHLLSIKQATEAILINLDLYKDDDTVQTSTLSEAMHSRIMISYSHNDRVFCRDFVRALKSNSVDVWVDEDGHCRSDDCWEEIAVAIKHASYVLVIVSPSYCQSVSCRKEATYADKRKKTLIAIYPNDKKYEPDEWLDIRLTGSYVRFGEDGKKSFDDCVSRVLGYIRPKEGNAINTIVPKAVPPPSLPTPASREYQDVSLIETQTNKAVPSVASQSVTITKSSIHDWTKNDVQTWFLIERNLLPQLYRLYSFVDGDALLEYAKHFKQEHEHGSKLQYEKLCTRLQNEFHIEFHDNNYTDLVCSMKKLLLAYDRQLPTTVNKTKKTDSQACLIL